jgi:hypothetical protein
VYVRVGVDEVEALQYDSQHPGSCISGVEALRKVKLS